MQHAPQVIGIVWYELEDFPRVKAVMADAHQLPRTYSEWRLAAEQLEGKLRRQGKFVVRVPLRADDFVAWCSARGLHVDAQARMQFANLGAAEQYRAVDKGPSNLH